MVPGSLPFLPLLCFLSFSFSCCCDSRNYIFLWISVTSVLLALSVCQVWSQNRNLYHELIGKNKELSLQWREPWRIFHLQYLVNNWCEVSLHFRIECISLKIFLRGLCLFTIADILSALSDSCFSLWVMSWPQSS